MHSRPWAIKHWLLLSSGLSTLSFGLMLYLGKRNGAKYWTSSESSQSLARGNTNLFAVITHWTSHCHLVWFVPNTRILSAIASHWARSARNKYNSLHVNWIQQTQSARMICPSRKFLLCIFLSRQCLPLIMFEQWFYFCVFSMAAWMIDEFGSEELRQKFIPALASMEVFQ